MATLQSRFYKAAVSSLKKPLIKAQLYFIISSAEFFTKFTQRFQGGAPLIHKLHQEVVSVLQVFMARVFKTSVIKKVTDFSEVNIRELFAVSNLLPLKELVISGEVADELSKLKENDKLLFLKEAQDHYIAACKHVMEKTCISNGSLKSFRFLDPKERMKARSCTDILKVSKMMPFDVQLEYLIDEWKLLQLEKEDTAFENKNIDVYWQQHISKRDLTSKDIKFTNVAQVIKASLTLSHGNADVERRFSISKHILGEDKSSMTERFLNSVLTVKDALNQYPHFLIAPIDSNLIKYGQQAHSRYVDFLEECKRKEKIELEDKQ